ncbi:MAG TPA: MerR family transcriptional regulator [Pseudonocardiaceae bacterium]
MTSSEMTIAQVAERTGLTRHTLRYYERDGLMLDVGRDGSGHRAYSEVDLGWIELITKLRATGMPVREVRRYAELVRAGDGNEEERLALLRAHRERVRAQLDVMVAHLAAIDMKIGYYGGALAACESPDSNLSSPRPVAAAAPC